MVTTSSMVTRTHRNHGWPSSFMEPIHFVEERSSTKDLSSPVGENDILLEILNFYPRTAAHCFCVDVGMIESQHKYCYKEIAEGPHIIKYD